MDGWMDGRGMDRGIQRQRGGTERCDSAEGMRASPCSSKRIRVMPSTRGPAGVITPLSLSLSLSLSVRIPYVLCSTPVVPDFSHRFLLSSCPLRFHRRRIYLFKLFLCPFLSLSHVSPPPLTTSPVLPEGTFKMVVRGSCVLLFFGQQLRVIKKQPGDLA